MATINTFSRLRQTKEPEAIIINYVNRHEESTTESSHFQEELLMQGITLILR